MLKVKFERKQIKFYALNVITLFMFLSPYVPSAPDWLKYLPVQVGLFMNVRPFVQAREFVNGQRRVQLICRSVEKEHKFSFDYEFFHKIAGPHRRKIYYIGPMTSAVGKMSRATMALNLYKGFCHSGDLAVAAGCPENTSEVEIHVKDVDGIEYYERKIRCYD